MNHGDQNLGIHYEQSPSRERHPKHYGETLWANIMGKHYGQTLWANISWGNIMGKHYGKALWENIMVIFMAFRRAVNPNIMETHYGFSLVSFCFP